MEGNAPSLRPASTARKSSWPRSTRWPGPPHRASTIGACDGPVRRSGLSRAAGRWPLCEQNSVAIAAAGVAVAAEAGSHNRGVDALLWEQTSVATATAGVVVAAEAGSHSGVWTLHCASRTRARLRRPALRSPLKRAPTIGVSTRSCGSRLQSRLRRRESRSALKPALAGACRLPEPTRIIPAPAPAARSSPGFHHADGPRRRRR